jgi:HEAT repeat protein
LVASEHAVVRRSLARVIGWGEATAPGANEILRILGDDPDVEVRRAALWSNVLVNREAASGLCRNRVSSGDADPFDVRVLGLIGGAVDLDPLIRAMESETLKVAAVRALGDLAHDGAQPRLRAILEGEDEALAEVASEVLEASTGSEATDSEGKEESMSSMWRRSLLTVDPDTKWLRREVPDGFFTAEPEPTAVPGE